MSFLRAVFRFRSPVFKDKTLVGVLSSSIWVLYQGRIFLAATERKNITDLLCFEHAQDKICDAIFCRGNKSSFAPSLAFGAENIKNLSLTLRAREKIWSRLVGKSNINRKRLLTFLNGAISWHNFCNMEQDSQTPRQKAANTFCFLLPWKKKNFHVLEQSKQNIEMGLVKKTMNREYYIKHFAMVVSLLKCFYWGITRGCYHGRHTPLRSGKAFSSILRSKR